MTSLVYYKFKSQREESRISFNGTGISVADLRQEIMSAKGLDKAADVDIVLLDPTTNEEYDDSRIIPRSSTVIVKRTPAKAGKNRANRFPSSGNNNAGNLSNGPRSTYVHSGPMSKRFDGKNDPGQEAKPAHVPNSAIQSDEAAAMEAMFAAESENWSATQAKMSQAQRVYTASRYGNRKPTSQPGGTPGSRSNENQASRYHPYTDRPDRPIPQGYVCYRCGQKGHWIQDCPTNKDREMDGKPRLKRTTGIPRSFLQTVDQPAEGTVAPGVMITPEGKLVIARPDDASWERQIGKHKFLTEADIRERPVSDPSLACGICSTLFRNAVRTPCCSTSFCEECIQTHLLENDFTCPKCKSKISSLDRLLMDKPTRTRVMDYIDKAIAEGNAELEAAEASGSSRQKSTPPAEETVNETEVSFDQQPGGQSSDEPIPTPGMADNQAGYQENQTFAQIQAEIQQLQTMLANPKLPTHVRNRTAMQLTQKQVLLNQAQTMSAFISQAQQVAAAEGAMMQAAAMYNPQNQQQMSYGYNTGGYNDGGWGTSNGNNPLSYSGPEPDSAYQRLPVNNRRRNVKRERPSDFVEVSGQQWY